MKFLKRILIADDEPPARAKLKRFLADLIPGAELLESQDGPETLELLSQMNVDLLFLDIKMPILSGLEVARAIGPDNMPLTIFVTAYDEFAIDAFELEAIDYLLKPFDRDRLENSLSRVFKRDRIARPLESLLQRLKQEQPLERMMVKDRDKSHLVAVKDMMWLRSEEKYVHLYTVKRNFFVRSSLGNLLNRLRSRDLVQINRRDAVNLEFVDHLESLTHGDMLVHMKDGPQLTLSRRFRHLWPESL